MEAVAEAPFIKSTDFLIFGIDKTPVFCYYMRVIFVYLYKYINKYLAKLAKASDAKLQGL